MSPQIRQYASSSIDLYVMNATNHEIAVSENMHGEQGKGAEKLGFTFPEAHMWHNTEGKSGTFLMHLKSVFYRHTNE
jgi:hypothetical protein